MPLGFFLSEVDKNAHPGARQQYVFTLANGEGHGSAKQENEETPKLYEESVIDRDLEAFLDERSYAKKLDILLYMRKKITDEMLDLIAAAMDMQLTGETTQERYEEALSIVKTRKKFERDRLR